MTEQLTVESVIRNRRTIHEFIADNIPDEAIIKKAIELAQWAPNHHLTEPWHFYRIGPETKEAICLLNSELVGNKKGAKLAEKKLQRWRAIPGWIFVSCNITQDARQQQEDLAAVSCAIQNFSLFLWSQGIGVKWSTGDVIYHPQFADLVWFDPEQECPVGLLWYGFASEVPQVSRSNIAASVIELP